MIASVKPEGNVIGVVLVLVTITFPKPTKLFGLAFTEPVALIKLMLTVLPALVKVALAVPEVLNVPTVVYWTIGAERELHAIKHVAAKSFAGSLKFIIKIAGVIELTGEPHPQSLQGGPKS